MFLRALTAFLVLPGVAAIAVPPLLASVDPWRGEMQGFGLLGMLAGMVLLIWCVRDFYVAGKGTLAPWDPPQKLVVVGLYRLVRNPMYVGVLLLVAGWATWLASPVLAAYAVVLAVGFHLRVRWHEEPWLDRRFGGDWRRYRAKVRRWWPRLSPWRNVSTRIDNND